MFTTHFETIERDALVTATGGNAAAPTEQRDAPQGRSWGQVARDYAGACVQGAGQAMVFGGRPRSIRDAATTAAVGCAMGVGTRAVEDVTNYVTGGGQ